MTTLKNNLYITYFETYNFGLTQKWVYVSNKDDDNVAQHHINAFQNSDWNTRNFTNAFIVSQESFDNTILPIIKEIGGLLKISTLIDESIDTIKKEDDTVKNTNNNYELKTWIMSDDDCFQHMKKLSDDGKQWRMLQLYLNAHDKYYVGYADIDLNDYLYPIDDDEAETIITILSGYGYDEFILGVDYNTELEHYKLIINNIKEIYKDSYLQVVAECIAEYEIGPDCYIIKPKNGVNFNQAKNIAYNFMRGEDN